MIKIKHISGITVNENGLNSMGEWQKLSDWITKIKQYVPFK